MADLLVIVPSRERPRSAARLLTAWDATGAWAAADLLFAVDADDPTIGGYRRLPAGSARLHTVGAWESMVAKLNRVAVAHAGDYFALAFAGDDHVPRTVGWAGRYLAELRRLGTGIVFGDDGHRGRELPTQWAMTSDIVRALGRMVPAAVGHQFCDRAVLDLGAAAGCIRYLPDVLIEHLHYSVGKAAKDAGYERVNRMGQWRADEEAWLRWRAERLGADAAAVRALRGGGGAGG